MILVDKKWKKVINEGISDPFKFSKNAEEWAKGYEERENFRIGVSWHIPTQSLVETIKEYSPILSVGCGFGYTEKLAEKEGADVILTDISPDLENKWCRNEKMDFPSEILKMDGKTAVKSFKDRNVFMAWPPYAKDMAYQVAKSMKVGRYLIYVGESHGGCTADDAFFDLLYAKFEEVESEAFVPSWSGIYDNVTIYKKIKR
jgi:hypothetical protein